MTKKIKLADCRPFDIAEYLDDEAMITEYMNSVLEENDPAMLASALGDIARARGMTQLAKETGLTSYGFSAEELTGDCRSNSVRPLSVDISNAPGGSRTVAGAL